MIYNTKQAMDILTLADNFAKQNTTCKKTAVGCYIVNEYEHRTVAAKGCNRSGTPCKDIGCLREQMYGDNSKEHRQTCRCYGHHAEQDAISRLDKDHAENLSAFVTRYPCDECAKVLIGAGVKLVVYGRKFPISEQAQKAFEEADVKVVHLADWDCDENDTNN